MTLCTLEVSGQTTNENVSNGQYFDGEPYMAMDPRNPDHIVVAWMGYTVGSPFGIKVKVSTDGGTSWGASTFLPHMSSTYHSADPSLAFDTAGYLFASYIDFHESPDSGGIFVVRSPDGGISWGTPVKVMDAYDDSGQRPIDRPWFCINPVTNHFYVTSKPASWVLPPCRPYLRVSVDGGATWRPWRYIDSTGYLVGSLISAPMATPAVGSDGVLHCIYPSYLPSQNVFAGYIHASSANDGQGFSYHGKYMNVTGNTDTLPKMGYHVMVDPTNPQHLVFNFPALIGNTDIDIYTIASTDGGVTWASPIRVNDDAVNNGKMQDMTWCGFDINGDYIVGWRDRRNAPGSGYSEPSEIWGAIMRHDSAHYMANFRISDTIAAFDATYLDGPGNDFMNIALLRDTLYAVWGDVRTGVLNVWFDRRSMETGVNTGILLTDGAIPAISIYPNPATNTLYISGEKVGEITISDAAGRIVLHQYLSTQDINISELAPGTYTAQLKTANGISVHRFAKSK
jgi:hypothetical protein